MKRKKIDWRFHILQWEVSGKSKYAYCKTQDLNAQSFANNFKKLRHAKENSFTELTVLSKQKKEIEFHYPDGRFFVFPAGCDAKMKKEIFSPLFL